MCKGPETSNGSFTQRQCGFLSAEGRVMRCGEVCRTLIGQRACKVKPWGELVSLEQQREGLRAAWLQGRGWEGARLGPQRPWP